MTSMKWGVEMIGFLIKAAECVISFWCENWSNVLLILVGFTALATYYFQERKKKIEAAALIIQQIDELQENIRAIQSYIVDGKLNETAFYESIPILENNYWSQYKHYFITDIDAHSYRIISKIFDYATEIVEQQKLMKSLQKNFFFLMQNTLTNMEFQFVMSEFTKCVQYPIDAQSLITGVQKTLPTGLTPEQEEAMKNVVKQASEVMSSGNVNFQMFWKNYNQHKGDIRHVIDQNGFTQYIPTQIRISLEGALKQWALFEVTSCTGYAVLKKWSKKRF